MEYLKATRNGFQGSDALADSSQLTNSVMLAVLVQRAFIGWDGHTAAASECAVFAILRLAFPPFDGEMMAKLLQQNECAAWRESPGLLSCAVRARLSTAWR